MTPGIRNITAITLVATALTGCASTPESLAISSPENASFHDWAQQREVGVSARWGGTVNSAFEIDGVRCLVVDALPLDGNAHPRRFGHSRGMFAACHPTLDPGEHAAGQQVTVVGTVRALNLTPDSPGRPLPAVVTTSVHTWNGSDTSGHPVAIAGATQPLNQWAGSSQIREPFSITVRLHEHTQFDNDD